jgi:phosphatidylglycerol:prolipoprotein diacylglycerol transferase
VQPTLFHVCGEAVSSYAAGTVVGYVAGVLIGFYYGVKDGRSLRDLVDIALVVVLSALLGSKLFHTLFEARGHVLADGSVAEGVVDLLKDDPWHWARLFEAGYVFYGGVVGAIALTYLYTVRRGVPDKGSIGDYGVPGLLFGTFVGRIGCFLGGCCFGHPTDMPWGVRFPVGHESESVPIHPVQLYDAAFGLLGLVLFFVLFAKRRFGGELFCGYIVTYAAFRFGTEMLRADSDRGVWLDGRLSTSQLVALATLPVTLFFWRRALRLVRAGMMRKPSDPLEPPT